MISQLGEPCARAVEALRSKLSGETFLFMVHAPLLPVPPPCDEGEPDAACEARVRAEAERRYPGQEIHSCTRQPGESCEVIRYGGRKQVLHARLGEEVSTRFMIENARSGPFEIVLVNPGEIVDDDDNDPVKAKLPRAKAGPAIEDRRKVVGIFWKPSPSSKPRARVDELRKESPELGIAHPIEKFAGWVMIRAECRRPE